MARSSVAWQVYVLYRDADQLNDLKRIVASAGEDNITMAQVHTLFKTNSYPEEWGKERIPDTDWAAAKTGSLPQELPAT